MLISYSVSANTIIFSICLIFLGCEPLAMSWDKTEDATLYQAFRIIDPPTVVDTLLVMTWNIRFGASRISWFGDGCGERVLLTENEVTDALENLARKITEIDPDILILQEIDVGSKRTAYINQVQWLLDHTDLNHGAYASYWQVQFIPSEGLGRMDAGNAILSRWKLTDTERIPLPLRGDQSALTQYFYLRRNIVKVKLNLPGYDNFWVVNIHAAAFSTDETKQEHIDEFKKELDILEDAGALFLAGGDLNELPSGSDSTDYCDEDKCTGESFHSMGDDPLHKEGSCYTEERTWLNQLYDTYQPAVQLDDYQSDNGRYYTFFTREFSWDDQHSGIFGGRKLDYLFTNSTWVKDTDSTYQELTHLSDHVPVSAKMVVTP